MTIIQVQPDDALARLEVSRTRLQQAAPDLSAERLMRRRQWIVLLVVGLLALVCVVLAPKATVIVVVGICTVVYLATVVHRVAMTILSAQGGSIVSVSDEEARAVPDAVLPVYTVLVPAFHEMEVIDTLLSNLGALEYPADKLDLKLLLEADDTETVDRAMRHPLADAVDIVLVPPGDPRTKPKALNYGLTLARGELVTIYDAEDAPDPLQLRRAVVAFDRSEDDVACLQAQLTYRNPDQNIITRWFTVEYLMWFTLFLPGLSRTDAPIPLGGTSNHIRRSALEGLGGWDPYNVTEDADLGVRLHRVGWRCAVLGSVTYEEANSDFVNWMKQRSRWYKGYLQTWLVHLRHPVRLWRELGWFGFLQFNLFVGGTPMLALLNPVFWSLTILWFLGKFDFIQAIFPAPVYYAGLICWALGNLSVLYITVLAARRSERPSLVLAALLVPIYWVMMSLSAIKAAIQLISAPTFWEKTTHGLDQAQVRTAAPAAAMTGAGARAAGAPAAPGPALPVTELAPPEGGWAPALAVAEARSTTTATHLQAAARSLRLVGVLAIALVVWLLAGTALAARIDAGDRADRAATAAAGSVRPPQAGDPVARVTAPRSGLSFTVLQGTGTGSLDHGVGHAPASALPGGQGNSVLVGHARLAGAPLGDLDQLEAGDAVKVQTPWGPAAYEVTSVRTVGADELDLHASGPTRMTIVTASGSATFLQATATMTGTPTAPIPAAESGYPSVPGSNVAALLVAVIWGALALAAWQGGRLLARRWGSVAGLLVAAPLIVLAVIQAFAAIGHALPATL
ncbi:glycosyltransferase family 2 protein [Aquihabitans sp. McL0605]|uniref:glycosyltransferase family 2 protein n=1 Tax=Aquihabitans sp. McL0605 TaxID=3415671 RepID=UPI003CE75861